MKHPASQHLYSYWNELRKERAAPDGNDIDPAAIRAILADTIMLEVETVALPRPSATIRLAGSRVTALFGTDLKDRCLSSLWRLADQSEVDDLVGAVLDDTCPAVAGLTASPAGRTPLALELLLVPLRGKGRTHARLLGTLSPAAAPDWLGQQSVGPLTLGPTRMINRRGSGASPIVADFARPRVPGRRCGPFVIYQGGRL